MRTDAPAHAPTPPQGTPAVPPPLPPEWSEALGHARAPLGTDHGGFAPDGFGAGGFDGDYDSFDSLDSLGGGPRLGGAGVPFGPPASSASALDRRSSAALEPPSVDRDRRNTVALSLAGLFDELVAPEITVVEGKAPAKRTTPSFFDMDDEADEAATAGPPRRTGLRGWFTPAGIVAVLAIIGSLYVVGYFVSKENPPKPPGDKVVTVSHTH
jgi:hypothetical protein